MLQIREATPADIDDLVRYNRAIAQETEGKDLDEATVLRGVTAVFGDRTKGRYLVAEQDGKVVGQLMLTTEWSDWRNGWYWWIQSVYVTKSARGNGVFRALYTEVERQAQADPEVIGLRLYVEHENAAARATYARLGMEEEPYLLCGLYPLPGRTSAYRPVDS